MASVQGTNGTWKTRYSAWTGVFDSFVDPEYDSVGNFIYGVYRHYMITGDANFLNNLWPIVQKAADWILNTISNVNGLGAADCSIWEEKQEYNSYTQAWYIAGLYAMQCLAEMKGDTTLTDWYAGGPASILTALQRPDNWARPGMWNSDGYYNRAVYMNNTARRLVDSSSNLLIALGIMIVSLTGLEAISVL